LRCTAALRRWAVVAALCVAVLLAAAPGVHAGDQEDLLTGYSVTTWNDGDGRPFGAVYAIAQDRRGYLWIGADAGLFRFDGSRFTASDDINDAPLPKAAVTALALSADGTLWVGFGDDSAIRRVRGGHVETLPRANAPALTSDLTEGRDGALWAVGDGALYQYDGRAWHRIAVAAGGRDARVRQVFLRRNGRVLVGTWLGTFERKQQSTGFERISPEVAWGLTEDTAGHLWTTDIAHGFRRMGQPASTMHSGAGYRVMFDRERNLWVATYGAGLWRVSLDSDSAQQVVYRAGLRTGLSSDLIQTVFEDRDGNIWVGTTTGVVKFSRDHDRWAAAQIVSHRPDVRSLYDDQHGTLWIGATEGLFRLSGGRLTQVVLPPRIRPQVAAVFPAPDKALWLSDGASVFRWADGQLLRLQVAGSTSFGRITYTQLDR